MKLSEVPGWAIAVSLVMIAVVFGFTALVAEKPFEVAGLRFGPVPQTSLTLTDAVIAFDTSKKIGDGCPQGWSAFEEAAGRFIVGAGAVASKKGVSLTSYPALQDGNEESIGGHDYIVLEADEIPSHSHGLQIKTTKKQHDGLGLVYDKASPYFVDKVIVISNDEEELESRESAEPGKKHYNMPPYVALVYCKPEGGG